MLLKKLKIDSSLNNAAVHIFAILRRHCNNHIMAIRYAGG